MSGEEKGRGVRSLGVTSLVQGSLCVFLMVSFEITKIQLCEEDIFIFYTLWLKK